MFNKRAISPVVASALLLVVAVVAVVGFQSWFNSYSTSMFSEVETTSSDSMGQSAIERVIGDTLFVKVAGTNSLSVVNVKIGSSDCQINSSLSPGINSINLSNCVSNISSGYQDIVLITEKGVLSKRQNIVSSVTGTNSLSENIVNLTFLGTSLFNINYSNPKEDLAIDSNNNIFFAGATQFIGGQAHNFYGAKYNSTGSQLWNFSYDYNGSNDYLYSVAVDSSGNSYFEGSGTNQSGSGLYDLYILKFDSDGNNLWNKSYLNFSGNSGTPYHKSIIDENGDLYIHVESQPSLTGFVAKIDKNNGDIIWNYSLGISYSQPGGLDFGPNGILYAGFRLSGNNSIVALNTSTGSKITNFSVGITPYDLKYNSSNGIIYLGGGSYSSTASISAINSTTGVEIWNVSHLNVGDSGGFGHGIALDLLGNIYLSGTTGSGISWNGFIAKFNSSGSKLWNYTSNPSEQGTFPRFVNPEVNSLNNPHVLGLSASTTAVFVFD